MEMNNRWKIWKKKNWITMGNVNIKVHNKALPRWFLNQGWKHKHFKLSIEITMALVTKKSHTQITNTDPNTLKEQIFSHPWSPFMKHSSYFSWYIFFVWLLLLLFSYDSIYRTIFHATLFTSDERKTETQVFDISMSRVFLYKCTYIVYIKSMKKKTITWMVNETKKFQILHETIKRYQKCMRKYWKY